MSIKVPILADPSSMVSALEQISAALRKTGQEGRKLSEIDFSHAELKPLAEDIKQLQDNFEELKKTGRGATAAAVRRGGYEDVMQWHKGYNRQFPDEKQRQNHLNTVSNYVSQGTSWAGSQSPDSGDGGKGGGGFFSGLPIPGMGKLLGIGLGLAGIGKVTSMVSGGVKGAQDEAIELDTFMRMLNDTSGEFDGLRRTVRDASDGLQMTYNETVKLAQSFAKTSAYTDSKRISEEVESSAGFARAFGLNPNQTTQMFGKARWMKAGGGSDVGPKEMAMMFAEAVASGNMWGKADEVLGAILGFVQTAESTTVDAPNVKGYAALTSEMNKSNRPGLQGHAGAALVGKMDSAIRAGGGAGDAGQNFLWRALSPDNDMGPFQMKLQQEKGMFGKLDDGRTNFEATTQLAEKMYANPLQRADALSRLYSTSMTQMMAMMELKPGSHGKLSDMMTQYGINPSGVSATSYQGLADVATADDARLQSLREDTLGRDDLTKEQRSSLQGASSSDDIRRSLATTLSVLGRDKNLGTDTFDAVVSVKNAVMESAEMLLEPINIIKKGVSILAELPPDVVDAVTQSKPGRIAPRMRAPMKRESPIVPGDAEYPARLKVSFEPIVIKHVNRRGRETGRETMPPPTFVKLAE